MDQSDEGVKYNEPESNDSDSKIIQDKNYASFS